MRSYLRSCAEAWRWSTIVLRHSLEGKTIKRWFPCEFPYKRSEVESRFDGLNSGTTLHWSFLHSLLLSCTNTARSVWRQVFSAGCWAAGGTRLGVSFPPPSLPLLLPRSMSDFSQSLWRDSVAVLSSMCMIKNRLDSSQQHVECRSCCSDWHLQVYKTLSVPGGWRNERVRLHT